MNRIAREIYLIHYGMLRRSGRYPWGSGKEPYQHSGDFLSRIDELKKQGLSDTEIAKSMGLTTTQFRTQRSLAKDERRAIEVETAKDLRNKGYSLNEIAEKMGYNNDSSVRSLLNENSEARMNQAKKTAEFLKKQIDEKGMIDVGAGVERELGISKEKMKEALYILELEGYPTYGGRVPQVTNKGKQTTLIVVCPPGTEHKDIYDYDKINSLKDYVSHDEGETFDPKFVYPKSMDSKRLQIRYAEDGGENKDGVIELRRGVDDLSLGNSHYAQVRILVDNNKYLKGMAVYGDDFPDGVDVIFNTNKKKGTPKEDVLKTVKDDPDNPFGSLIKEGINDPDNPSSERGGESYYYDKNGKKQLSLINKRAEEGDWGDWADKLPSQFLSKQSMSLIKKQLNLAEADKQAEFDDICSLTNPTVKKVLLKSFADDCDAAAEHLKAAALPRQKYQVILPLTSIKDNEVYAPNYRNGETVALVRFPHGGTFEIPILKVNNKQPEGLRVLGNTPADAIGINKKVADRLSGADFDGDTVMVIPCNSSRSKVRITSTNALEGLKDFDPKLEYGGKKPGTFKEMKNTQTEMGKISNLITDMTLKDKETGEQSDKEVVEEYVDKDGKVHTRMQRSTKMAETRDARTLSSGTPQEEAYADYANSMKALANQARKVMANTGKIEYSSSAKATYSDEVNSLMYKLNDALKNAPRERKAQAIANSVVEAKKKANPDMSKAEIKKASQQALTSARASVGAKRTPVQITDKEWEAIQAGAISENKLLQILNNTDIDEVRKRATPRTTNTLSQAKINRIATLRASGYSTSEIAEALGVSSSTVSKYLN